MDSYTVLRTYANVLLKLSNEAHQETYHINSNEFTISPIVSEVLKKVEHHRYVLLSNEGHLYGMDSVNTPIPEFFKGKRYMKTNPRAGIKDIIKVLYNLLSIPEADQTISLQHFITILHFVLAFQLENDEAIPVMNCDFIRYIRRQFFHCPSFFPDEKLWKRKYRDPAILSFYECGDHVESLSNNLRQKTEELNSMLESHASSIISIRQTLNAQQESTQSLYTVISSLNGDHQQLVSLHNQVAQSHQQLEDKHNSSIDEIQNSLEDKGSSIIQLQNSLSDNSLADKHNSLADKHNSLEDKHNSLADKHNSLEDKHNSLADKHNSLADKHNALEDKHNSLEDKHNSLEDKHNSLEDKHDALDDKHNSLADKHNALEDKHDSLDAKHSSLEDKHNSLDNNTIELLQKHQNLEELCQELVEKNKKLSEELLQLRIEVSLKLSELGRQLEKKNPLEVIHEEEVDTPSVVEEVPAVVEEVPAVVEEVPAVVEDAPVVVEEAPVVVEEAPAVVEEAPAVVEEAPVVVEEAPVVVEEAPVVVEEAPVVVEEEQQEDIIICEPELVQKEEQRKPQLGKQVSIAIKCDQDDSEDDIELSRIGQYFVIKGTRVVMNMEDGNSIGYLDECNQLIRVNSDEVKKACLLHRISFSA